MVKASDNGPSPLADLTLADDSAFWSDDMKVFGSLAALQIAGEPGGLQRIWPTRRLFELWSADEDCRVSEAAVQVHAMLYAPGGPGFDAAREQFEL